MPSLHQLWKCTSLSPLTQGQGRLRSVFPNVSHSPLNSKPFYPSCRRKLGSRSSFSFRIFQSLFSGLFSKSSEVADLSLWQGKPLSASEAVSRVFATPSVHGPVWQSYHSCQVVVEKSQCAQSKRHLEWTVTNCGISRSRRLNLETKFHVWALDVQSEGCTPGIAFSKRWEDQRDGVWEDEMQRLTLKTATVRQSGLAEGLWLCWTGDSGDTGGRGDFRDNKSSAQERQGSGHGGGSQLQRLLRTSLAFYFLRAGPCIPALNELFQNAVNGSTYEDASAMQLALMLDSFRESVNSEVEERDTDGWLRSKGLKLLSGACCLPHPEKEDTGGEDAYFICADKHVVGVADGVGGWATLGIDAGEYARELMNQSLIAARQEPCGSIDPARVLERAHSKTTCKGSSTACILALTDYGLRAANLGDSGFVVLRNGRMIFKSPAQQHRFNMPFQLESGGSDPPSAAQVFTVEVTVGDVIVAGTDGLFDNVFDTELTSIVVDANRCGLSPDITAQKIASLARLRAEDLSRQTPFSTAAQDAGFRFYGGKLDDITVVVSYIRNL